MSPFGLLFPVGIPTAIWENISMDFIEGLPKARGYDVIFVIVDRLSKAAHFLPLKHPFNAKNVANLFVKAVVRHHGFPQSIVSDRDKTSLSHFWTKLFHYAGIKLHHSLAYHYPSTPSTLRINMDVII